MSEKGKSTPPQGEETEKGLPVPVWFIAGMLVLTAIAVIFGPSLLAGMSESATDTTNSGGSELNQPPASGADTGTNIVPEETATEAIIPTQETGVKFLKKIGPFNLPSYGETADENVLVVQKESFSLEGSDEDYFVGITSTRESGISFSGFPTEPLIILMVLRDESGNSVSSKIDETTGSLYFARGIVDPNPTTLPFSNDQVKISVEEKKRAQTWEVLVYSY